jgi:hypothetical protein
MLTIELVKASLRSQPQEPVRSLRYRADGPGYAVFGRPRRVTELANSFVRIQGTGLKSSGAHDYRQ